MCKWTMAFAVKCSQCSECSSAPDEIHPRYLKELTDHLEYPGTIRDLFHVYLNKCEFHFSRLHVNKINNFCFLLSNVRVPCMTK